MLSIVGLGPSNCKSISVGAYRVIRSAPTVFVRTARHPAVQEIEAEGVHLIPLDDIYESSETFNEVYTRIADRVLSAASKGDVVYAVPGHPLVGEEAARILIQEAKVRGLEYQVIGSESFIEASLEAIGISLDTGLKILDALSLDRVSPSADVGNLIYQVYDRNIASDVKLKLMELYPDEFEIAVVNGGAPQGEQVKWIPLYMLDRVDVDHLTSVWIPERGNMQNDRG